MGDRIIRKVEAGAERLSKKVENLYFTNINKNNKIKTSASYLECMVMHKYDFGWGKIRNFNMKRF